MDSTTSNSSRFDDYYQEFSQALHAFEDETSNSSKKEELDKQCSDLLRLMSVEARSTEDPDQKFERLERVKIYKFQLEAIQNKNKKDFLMGEALERNGCRSSEQMQATLRQNEAKVAQQNELLERAKRTAAETEESAMGITEELHSNREKIESAQKKVDDLSSLTARGMNVATNMLKPWWRRR